MLFDKKLTREDRVDILESALTDIDRAMAALDECAEYREFSYDLAGIANDLQEELDQLNAEAEREYAEMIADMTREYWGAVL